METSFKVKIYNENVILIIVMFHILLAVITTIKLSSPCIRCFFAFYSGDMQYG